MFVVVRWWGAQAYHLARLWLWRRWWSRRRRRHHHRRWRRLHDKINPFMHSYLYLVCQVSPWQVCSCVAVTLLYAGGWTLTKCAICLMLSGIFSLLLLSFVRSAVSPATCLAANLWNVDLVRAWNVNHILHGKMQNYGCRVSLFAVRASCGVSSRTLLRCKRLVCHSLKESNGIKQMRMRHQKPNQHTEGPRAARTHTPRSFRFHYTNT